MRLDQDVSQGCTLAQALRDFERAKQYGVQGEILDTKAIIQREPHLSGEFAGAIHFTEPGFVLDPGGLAKAYAALFHRKGGRFMVGDAQTLEQEPGGRWQIATPDGRVSAREVVVALGPWSDLVFGRLGYSIPLNVKRGYHLHLAPRGNAVLHHPVLDADNGYVLAPMNRGIRLATGVEFARRDAPATPVQLERALPLAHKLFPLGEADRRKALERRAAVSARYAAGDREGASSCRAVVRFRPPPPRPDARPRDRPAAGGNDDRRDAVRRSHALCRRAFRLTIPAE